MDVTMIVAMIVAMGIPMRRTEVGVAIFGMEEESAGRVIRNGRKGSGRGCGCGYGMI